MPSTTHDGWGARDDLPYGRVAGGHAHVQAATLAVAVVDLNRIREERKTNGKTCRLKTRPTPSSAQY